MVYSMPALFVALRGLAVEAEPTKVTEVPPPPVSWELKRRWSHFFRKVYETDPLVCAKWSGEMDTISFIDQPECQSTDKRRSTSRRRSCVWIPR
jgi:hypothetical protein